MITLINHQGLKTVRGLQIQTPSAPIGLAYLGAYLKRYGYRYQAIDACGEALDHVYPYGKRENVLVQGLKLSEVLDRVPRDTTIIGFSCLFSHCWPLVLDMARPLRRRFSQALFVAGGEHPTAMPNQVLRDFDVVVRGEGEETFLELVQKLNSGQSWKEIEGISYKNVKGEIVHNNARQRIRSIDSFPYPDWDSWFIENYIQENQVSGINLGRSMPFLGSRGCPYECTFCSNPEMWTQRYLMRDPKQLVDEMVFMKEKYQVNGFTFMDSTFVIHREKTLAFANELITRKLNVTYQLPAGTRCEAFDSELAQTLAESGLRNFAFAPESGSEEILKVIKKKVKLDRFFQAVKTVLKTKMTVGCFVVIGFPEDTKATLKKTLRLIRRLALMGIHDITVSKFTPYPGSRYFEELVRQKKLSNDMTELDNIIDFFSDKSISYSPAVSSRGLYLWMLRMFFNFYLLSFLFRPWRVLKNFWDYFTKGVENTRYMRFFTEQFILRGKWVQRNIHT